MSLFVSLFFFPSPSPLTPAWAGEGDPNKAADPAAASASYFIPLQKCIYRFLCKALVGTDLAADGLVDWFGPYILDVWLGLQLVPTQKVGVIPQPLEKLLLHSFPLPSFVVKPGYDLLYRFVEKHGAAAVSIAGKEHGISRKDAINNILFVLGFNAFDGFSVFLPFLIMEERERDRLHSNHQRLFAGAYKFAFLKYDPGTIDSPIMFSKKFICPVIPKYGKPFKFRTYFLVSDISEVRVEGLETLDYLDNLQHEDHRTEHGDAVVSESEVDKVYLSAPSKIVIIDHDKKRTFKERGTS
ncbi:hypothetical protein E2562_009119 [Oryza meyeriana var. granulata]|uniref:Uncharacterized protein n=1 Tax=Oryza meyeriana var. granulata TaxID=110450 RepID=A0A6G1D0A7_9ORYZ|nr:hypothetical protein E2562_009119 [Oryza meyeriana var. granulata]